MNKVFLIGRLTNNIELRYTEKKLPIATFSIAINRDYKNADGEYETDFINCKAFQMTAELIGKYTKKGDLIAIDGSLRTNSYEDKEGNKKRSTEVLVSTVQFLQQKTKRRKRRK